VHTWETPKKTLKHTKKQALLRFDKKSRWHQPVDNRMEIRQLALFLWNNFLCGEIGWGKMRVGKY